MFKHDGLEAHKVTTVSGFLYLNFEEKFYKRVKAYYSGCCVSDSYQGGIVVSPNDKYN
jgi:hypothetical protein